MVLVLIFCANAVEGERARNYVKVKVESLRPPENVRVFTINASQDVMDDPFAISCALWECGEPYVIILSGDYPTSDEFISNLIKAIRERYEVKHVTWHSTSYPIKS